jgi:hypothetical protein
MNLFDIYFLNDVSGTDMPGYHSGEIRVGTFCENFVVDVSFWPRARYEQQWLSAAALIMTVDRAAMIVSLGEPSSSNFVRWWALYRDGDSVAMQEQICFLDELGTPFDPERVEKYVRPRETASEEGQPISEWYTTVTAISDFLKRRSRE